MLLQRLCFKLTLVVTLISIYADGFANEPSVNQTQSDTAIRDSLKSGGYGPEMVVVPAGDFRMGCIEEEDCPESALPVHEVSIVRFALGKYEVTFEEYDKFAKATEHRLPQDFGWGREDRPVLNVSWNDAQRYVVWLSKETGEEYRLPSEAEWEYAARAGSDSAFFFGNDASKLCEYTNHADSSSDLSWRNTSCSDGVAKQTSEVGRYLRNPWGLHDMHGNAWTSEGCVDRVLRGGSFNSDARFLSSSFRLFTRADYQGHVNGFRVARTVKDN